MERSLVAGLLNLAVPHCGGDVGHVEIDLL